MMDVGTKDLLIEARKDDPTFELILHSKLADNFPLLFSSIYYYWADIRIGSVGFRSFTNSWEISPRNWWLRFLSTTDSIMELVINVCTTLFYAQKARRTLMELLQQCSMDFLSDTEKLYVCPYHRKPVS